MKESDRTRTGSKSYTIPGVNAECFQYVNNNCQPCACGYKGKSDKPKFRYRYRSLEDAITAINEFLLMVEKRQESDKQYKIEQLQKKKEIFSQVEVGSIFVSSWGYDQTNVDAYQVIEKKGTATVILREIGLNIIENSDHGNMSCSVLPDKDSFLEKSEPFEKRVNGYGITMNSYSTACLWDGESSFYNSWYA